MLSLQTCPMNINQSILVNNPYYKRGSVPKNDNLVMIRYYVMLNMYYLLSSLKYHRGFVFYFMVGLLEELYILLYVGYPLYATCI